MSDANRTKLSYVKNSTALGGTVGVLKTNPSYKQLLVSIDGLRGTPKYAESQTIVASARIRSLRRVAIEAGGNLGLEFIYGNVDELLEGLFFSTWQRTPQRYNTAADTQITDIVAATGVITVLTADPTDENRIGTFAVGHLVRAEGETTNPGNNFLKRATAASATSVTVAIAGLVNNTAPNLGYKLKAVGVEAPAVGNIAATTAGLGAGASGAITFTGVDAVAAGFVAGMWFKASLFAGTVANNGFYRALTVTTTRVECDIVPTGFATDTAAAVQVRLWMPDYLRDGTATVVWYDFERQLQDLTTPEYDTFLSMVPSQFGLDMTPQGIMGCSMDFVGANFANGTSRASGVTDGPADAVGAIPRSGEMFDTSSNVAMIREGSAALAAIVTQVGFALANGLSGRAVISQLGFAGFNRARFRPTATLRSYYASNVLRAKLLGDTLTGIASVLTDPIGTRAFIIDYPSGKFTEGNLEGIQVDGQRQLPLTFQAVEHLGYNCSAQLFRFPEYA